MVAGAARTVPRRAGAAQRDTSAAGLARAASAADAPTAKPGIGRRPPNCARRAALQPRLDALIDAIATLSVESQISGEMVSHLPPTRRAGSKPFFIEGLNALTKEWEPPLAGQRYRVPGRRAAGQPRTALNEIEYSEFVQKVRAFADGVGAMADFPDMLEVVARARSSTPSPASTTRSSRCTCARARWPGAPGFIQQHAARHGFVPGMVPGGWCCLARKRAHRRC